MAPRRSPLTGLLIVAVSLLVVAAGFAVVSLVVFISAGDELGDANQDRAAATDRLAATRADDDLTFTRTRDHVNKAGQESVVTMNSVDYRNVDEGLQAWERVTTGALHDQVLSLKEKSRQTIVAAQSVTKATVMSSAALELDIRAGKAVVLVAIKMNTSTNGTEAQDKYQRIEATLARTESGWKLEGIGIVALPGAGS